MKEGSYSGRYLFKQLAMNESSDIGRSLFWLVVNMYLGRYLFMQVSIYAGSNLLISSYPGS